MQQSSLPKTERWAPVAIKNQLFGNSNFETYTYNWIHNDSPVSINVDAIAVYKIERCVTFLIVELRLNWGESSRKQCRLPSIQTSTKLLKNALNKQAEEKAIISFKFIEILYFIFKQTKYFVYTSISNEQKQFVSVKNKRYIFNY